MLNAFASRLFMPLLGMLCLAGSPAHAADELLEPEKAFQFSAQQKTAGQVEARFTIADGYFLYHNKIRFSADKEVTLGKPDIPKGKVKQDEFMGQVETHRGNLQIRIPVTLPAKAVKAFNLKAEFQGCADAGVCYSPQEATTSIKVVAAAPTSTAATPATKEAEPTPPMQQQSPDVLARLKNLTNVFSSEGDAEFLSPEEAFQLTVSVKPDHHLEAQFKIAPQYYLYRDKIRFKVADPAGVSVSALTLPPAEQKEDPYFGKTFIYHAPFTAAFKLNGVPANTTHIKLEASYQGCSEKGICYPPQDVLLDVDLSTATAMAATPAPAPAPATTADTSESGRAAEILKGGNFWVIIASFFGFGLLLSLTPCVFPMIPILSGIIVGGGSNITKVRGFSLSLSYVLGMAMTYTLVGIAAALSGTLISNALQNPWALGSGAAIFVALAFSMFGFYELQMPSFLQSRFTEASNKMQGGSIPGVFSMGILSALIVGPCVAAPLAGTLLYISQTGDVVVGGVSLFSLAMGMGVPLLLVGLSAGALLPRAGAWMEAVKKFFGVALLAVAIWLISPLLAPVVQMVLWAVLLIISAIYLHALDPLPAHAKGFTRFWKGVGVVVLLSGVSMLLGALGGGRDILQPLSVFQGGAVGAGMAQKPHLVFKRVKNVAELDAAITAASGKAVMLDFYADWCVSCKELENFTFADAQVQARLKDVVLLQADVTHNTADDKALLKRFKLFGPPGILFFDKDGKEQTFRVVGYEKPEQFLASLDKVLP